MQYISQSSFISLTIPIVLRVARLHLSLHVFEKVFSPCLSLLRTTPWCRWSTIRNQSSHCFQVSVLLDLLLSIFLFLNYCAFNSFEILLVPPFPLILLGFLDVELIMVIFPIAVAILLNRHHRRSIKSSQISIAPKPLQHWVLMELWNCILRDFGFWYT